MSRYAPVLLTVGTLLAAGPLACNQEKPKEEPVKENDHLMDAIRYAIYNYSARGSAMPRPTTGLVKPFPGMP